MYMRIEPPRTSYHDGKYTYRWNNNPTIHNKSMRHRRRIDIKSIVDFIAMLLLKAMISLLIVAAIAAFGISWLKGWF